MDIRFLTTSWVFTSMGIRLITRPIYNPGCYTSTILPRSIGHPSMQKLVSAKLAGYILNKSRAPILALCAFRPAIEK